MSQSLEAAFRYIVAEELARQLPILVEAVSHAVATATKFDPDDQLDINAVAELIGKSVEATRKLFQRGVLPGRHVGKKWVARRGDLINAGLVK